MLVSVFFRQVYVYTSMYGYMNVHMSVRQQNHYLLHSNIACAMHKTRSEIELRTTELKQRKHTYGG